MSHRFTTGDLLLEMPGESRCFKLGSRIRIAFNRSCALTLGSSHDLSSAKEGAAPFRKPLQVIVMSVIVVMSVTFPYTYKDFLHDGKLVGS
jgi:hypothetical protein